MSIDRGKRRSSSIAIPSPIVGFRSRRGSWASVSSKAPPVDKEALSNALDEIHTTASKQDTLTSFSDYDAGGGTRVTGPKEPVSGGLAGLYSRFRQSVAGGSPDSMRPHSRGSLSKHDTESIKSVASGPVRSRVDVDVKRSSSSNRASKDMTGKLSGNSSPRPDRDTSAHDTIRQHDQAKISTVSHVTSPLAHKRSANISHLSLTDRPVPSQEQPREREQQAPPPKIQLDTKMVNPEFAELKRVASGPKERETAHAQEDDDDDNAILSSDSDDEDTRPVADNDKRFSMQSQQSLRTPDSKTEAKPARQRIAKEKSLESMRDISGPPPVTSGAPNSVSASNGATSLRPLARIAEKGPPTVNISRASSTMDVNDTSRFSAASSAATTPRGEYPPNLNAGFRRSTLKAPDGHRPHTVVPAHLKRRVVSKEFWMKDENARDCFYCGDAFSTFRRKHHCRTCGQIFDAKCTTLVSGRPFDLPGTLRLCRPCEAVIYGSDDDSTVFTDDEEDKRASLVLDTSKLPPILADKPLDTSAPFTPGDAAIATPSIGIPASRRNRESKRRSAVIEFDAAPTLTRPGSSRSLKSLGGRPRSSSHRRHPSKHQHMRSIKHALEERGPFHQDSGDTDGRQLLPAFHNDNIIDPDLAPFMSDEGSDDDQASIFTVLNNASHPSSFVDHDRGNLSSLVHSNSKKGRSRAQSDRFKDVEIPRPPTRTGSKLRKRNPSIASINFPRPSPRRSRSQTLLFREAADAGMEGSDAGSEALGRENLDGKIKRSNAMHGIDAPKVELNRASLQHVRNLLSQLLQDSKVTNSKSWEKALMPILLQCTDDVDPDVQHGDDMDIRNYIKLKKVPGGRPGDTAYVSGVVFSKNIALKGMKRSFVQPRIVIVTFALEYARHNTHFMSLDPILAQEREYLRNLVGRIVALQPQVLLVQRNVSGLALQMLNEAGITVIHCVKESVLAAVARVTKTIMIKTIDKLSMDPSHLGHCDNFDVKTYIHKGVKKTYIFISGCQPNLGCTLVLRGATTETLRQVKRVTEFMCYVVYNLKLETCLMRDEFALIPSNVADVQLKEPKPLPGLSQDPIPQQNGATKNQERSQSSAASIDGSVISTRDGAIPPGASQVMDPKLHEGEDSCEDESIPSHYRDLVKTSQTQLMSSSPFVKFNEPYLLKQALEQERHVDKHKRLLNKFIAAEQEDAQEEEDTAVDFEMIQPDMLHDVDPKQLSKGMRRFLQDVFQVQYQKAIQDYYTKKKQWDSFFEGSNGNPFDPFLHQNIFVLQSLVSSVTSAPCAGPEVIGLAFYADYEHQEMNYQDDCTLGQFVEDMCFGAGTACRACGRKMVDHHRQYVHGNGQLTVSVTRYPSKIKGLQNSILMWSTCKICNQETTVIPMSDNTWKYSFGKYLELSFWSTPLKARAGLCPHDIHKDFVRCFGFQDQCVRVQYDGIEIYEVVVPNPTINWAVKSDLMMKNRLYSECVNKLEAFISSVKARLESINLSTVSPDKAGDASAALEKLMQRADHDHHELLAKIQTKYMVSRYYEVVPLNRAIRFMDEKAIAWDTAFNEFERDYFPSETDIRNLATLQLKKIFLDRTDNATGEVCEGVEMKDGNQLRRINLTDDMLQSEKAQNMLSAVLEEQINFDGKLSEKQPAPIESPTKRQLMGSPDARQSMSIGEVERAVDRDDVKHLDLAVPVGSPDQTPNTAQPTSLETPTSPLGLDSNALQNDQDPFQEPRPLNSTLVEKIEQIRAAAAQSDDENKQSDSRIPRLVELQRKPGNSVQAPQLIRAQSQPNHVPRRSTEKAEFPPFDSQVAEQLSETESESPDGRKSAESNRVESKLIERIAGSSTRPVRPTASMIPRSVPVKAPNDTATRVSALAKHFEQLSREFEKERLRERRMRAARMRQSRATHLPSSQPVVEVFKDASEAVSSKPDEAKAGTMKPPGMKRTESSRSGHRQRGHEAMNSTSDTSQGEIELTDAEHTDNFTDNERASTSFGHGASDTEVEGDTTDNELQLEKKHKRLLDPGTTSTSATLMSPTSIPDLELPLPKHEKSSLMKMLSSFWSERSASGWAPLDYPLNPTEHVFDDSDIVVREDEPSSVIALALSSNDYLKKLKEFRTSGRNRSKVPTDGTMDDVAIEQAAIEASLISETGTHMKYSFGHNQVRAQCKIFYAESFDALRRKCGVSPRFVESLSRSIKWDSKGGKTKSLFLKTLDDRFVIKSLQEVELKAFTRFAPDYFAFMSHTLFRSVPSVIAKMFGLFQVMIKNPATGVEFSSYLLVMENLFYDHKPNRRFDLKGSMRNRKIESTGQPDEVLLDENLVETIFETPLFVREHARKLVKASVWNDTMWLCRQNVMDYSLMAGFDDPSRQLFVGIIDCIRTYTWDKKLESWIKDRGKNKPTITSPKDYRNRFRVSMMQYVLQAPNVYHEFSRGVGVGGELRVWKGEGQGTLGVGREEGKRNEEGQMGEREREREDLGRQESGFVDVGVGVGDMNSVAL
ncbi:1-phosphatidylinositol 3-phosphate 5-kinase fab1 [Elsinoe australis]|uniref:1-phosphatidylinositol-3-phosphate 5-kinase n=1 Tax=Elsinoe australis TaxID=40998 RepID=A0A2P8A1G1_9PEZI|nr:1-phosphatidylinositol 3-phosphate 5-kinase fab1 [Elsinoe australis]